MRTALLVIDMQIALVDLGYRARDVLACVSGPLRRARGRGAGHPLSLGYDVTLVADGHTTRDGLMPAAEIIRHHNAVLGGLAHPDHQVTVLAGHDVRFEEE